MLDIMDSDQARARLKRGMQVVADAVVVTLGPCAHPTVDCNQHAPTRIARTGRGVAMSIFHDDRVEETGAALLRQVAEWAQKAAGDGTATAVVVAHLLARECVNLVGNGFDPATLREGIDAALADAERHLARMAEPAACGDILRRVAATAGSDAGLARLVAETARRAGAGALVIVDATECADVRVATVDGMRIEAGYAAPALVTLCGQRHERQRLHDPLVLLMRSALDGDQSLAPILTHARLLRRSLLVVASEVAVGAIAALIQQCSELAVRVLVVDLSAASADAASSDRLFEELAVLTGATIFDHEGTHAMPMPCHLGTAGVVLADSARTLIAGTPSRRPIHVDGDGDGPQIAVLQVPRRQGNGDVRVRAERAAHAVHGAARHGAVPGGGVALLAVAALLAETGGKAADTGTRLGYSLVQRALEEPFRQLAQNAGIAPGRAMRWLYRRNDLGNAGLSLPAGEVVDVVAAGILDPLPVLRGVLHAASSAVRLLLATETAAPANSDSNRHHEGLGQHA